MNILIADDNPISCKLLRAVLESEDQNVMVATDGYQVLEILEKHAVDAIICDLLVPNLDGYRLCREIRQDGRWPGLPFICYTAIYGSLDDKTLAFDLGANAYLRKPSSRAIILSTLYALIDDTRALQQPPCRRY